MAKFLIFDLETTGLDYIKCAIIQLAGYIIETNENNEFKVLNKFDYKIKPHENAIISPEALNIAKVSTEQIMSYKSSSSIFHEFETLLHSYIDIYNKTDKLILVGYNSLHFDQDFLKNWFIINKNKYFFSYFWSNGIDLLSDASKYFIHYRPAFPNFKLNTIAKALDISFNKENLHNGMKDAELTLKIFLKLYNKSILNWDEQTAINLFNKLNNS